MYVLALYIIISNIIGTHTRAVTDTQTIILNVVIDEVVTIGQLFSAAILLVGGVIRAVLLVVDAAFGSVLGILAPVLLIALVSCVILVFEAIASDEFGTIDNGCIVVIFLASFKVLGVVAAVVVLFVDAVLAVVVSKQSIANGNSRDILSPKSVG